MGSNYVHLAQIPLNFSQFSHVPGGMRGTDPDPM